MFYLKKKKKFSKNQDISHFPHCFYLMENSPLFTAVWGGINSQRLWQHWAMLINMTETLLCQWECLSWCVFSEDTWVCLGTFGQYTQSVECLRQSPDRRWTETMPEFNLIWKHSRGPRQMSVSPFSWLEYREQILPQCPPGAAVLFMMNTQQIFSPSSTDTVQGSLWAKCRMT